MAQTLVSVARDEYAAQAATPISFGPIFLRPVITLLYGLLAIRPQVVFPRINRFTIPDMWSTIFRNPFRLNFNVESNGITSGVGVYAMLTVLGFSVSVNGAVFRWSDLLALNVQVGATTVGVGLGVNVRKPGSILDDARREGTAQGIAIERTNAQMQADAVKAERAEARAKSRRRRR